MAHKLLKARILASEQGQAEGMQRPIPLRGRCPFPYLEPSRTMNKITQGLAACALTVAVVHASAAPTLYADRATFEAAITVGQTVDFESDFGFAHTSISFGDATFVSTNGSGIHRTTGFGGSSVRLAAQNSGGIRIDLAPGHRAIGMDVGELFAAATGRFDLVFADGGVGSNTVAVGYHGSTPSFIGWISDVAIRSVEFTVLSGPAFEAIDNVTLGAVNNDVPEPGALALVFAGLAAAFATRRRQRG
jgi:PEP-CTERM motif